MGQSFVDRKLRIDIRGVRECGSEPGVKNLQVTRGRKSGHIKIRHGRFKVASGVVVVEDMPGEELSAT